MADPLSSESSKPLFPLWLMTAALLILSVIAIPLFLCSPVTSDTSLFDVQAMTVLKGGVLYRDVLEPNLPGIVWVHIGLRTLIGWSSEAVRTADLAIFVLTLFLFAQLVHATRRTKTGGPIAPLLFASALFYLTRNEWCHCQRDIWMLLPVCCALWLRVVRIEDTEHHPWNPFVEGVFWGIAFWVKPHVALPVIAIVAVDSLRLSDWRERATDLGKVVAGGLMAGVPGIVWLISTGAWSHFWEMMLEWNPEYLATGRTRRSWDRIGMMLYRFHPWWIVHCVAVPLAVAAIVRRIRLRQSELPASVLVQVVLCTCYIAWLSQTFLIQHAMDYIHVPEVLLGLCVIAAHPWSLDFGLRRVGVAALLGLAVLTAPQFRNDRMSVWARCFTEGSSPEIRSVLAQGNYPPWKDLAAVKQFLVSQDVSDGDVACLNVHSIHLHQELAVLPATRYSSISHPLTMYPTRHDQIMTTVTRSRQRFVVVEERETSHNGQALPSRFPREFDIVFEAGTYKVYEVSNDKTRQFASYGNPASN